MNSLAVARIYVDRGWACIPIPVRKKRPSLPQWEKLRIGADELERYFPNGACNVGVLLGDASDGLIDVDLDCPEAVTLAAHLLPPTEAIFGHRSKPASHRLYRGVVPCGKTCRYSASSGENLVEIRGSGGQTVFPGSVHTSGEPIEWESGCNGDPQTVDLDKLRAAVKELAAACLILRHYPRVTGSRHDYCMALAGGLLRSGWSLNATLHFVETIATAAGDEELDDRIRTVESTADVYHRGGEVTGWTRLGELVGDEKIHRRVRGWLERPPKPGGVGAPAPLHAAVHPEPERGFPVPVPAPELCVGANTDIVWPWEPYIAVGHITLLTGLWKAGKSTLIGHLLRLWQTGGSLVGPLAKSRTLVVGEESEQHWARRRDVLGLDGSVDFILRPFISKPSLIEWQGFVSYLAKLIEVHHYATVVFDTFSTVSPIKDENDAARTIEALLPLNLLTAAGAAVLLVHHPRKGDAAEAQASRGSGALPGFVDVIVELRRYKADDREDTRRTLTAYSRFDETPPEAVIELGADGYRFLGTKNDCSQADRIEILRDLLPDHPPGERVDKIKADWESAHGSAPSVRTIAQDLRLGIKQGYWSRTGKGVAGDPFLFFWQRSNGGSNP